MGPVQVKLQMYYGPDEKIHLVENQIGKFVDIFNIENPESEI